MIVENDKELLKMLQELLSKYKSRADLYSALTGEFTELATKSSISTNRSIEIQVAN